MTLSQPNLVRQFGFFLVVGLAALAAGCKTNPVGRQCFVPTTEQDGGVPTTVIGSPALECQSRICLHLPNQSPDLCTAECETANDCDTSPESPCQGGFVCMVPTVTGNFCCKKMCVCSDYLSIPDGGAEIPTPEACDESVAANECCNLAGRPECR